MITLMTDIEIVLKNSLAPFAAIRKKSDMGMFFFV